MTLDEVRRRDEKMREQRCYRFCTSCEGCANYTGNRVKCKNCAPEYRQCICAFGCRRFLTRDGFIAIKEFGLRDPQGRDVTKGPLIRIRQVVPPSMEL